MKIEKTNVQWYVVFGGLLLVLIAGGKHWQDTRQGAQATGQGWLSGRYLILFLAIILCLMLIGYLCLIKKIKSLELLFLVCGLGFGLFYCFVLPPLSAPDEVSHYISAYKLSNYMMGKKAVEEHGLVYIRSEDFYLEDIYGEFDPDNQQQLPLAVLGQELTQETYVMIRQKAAQKFNTTDQAVSNQWTVRTTPAAYIPQALGITLARLFHLNSIWLLYLGRLGNLLFFGAAMYGTIRRLPFGKEVAFGAALLPMSLHLAGSMSYDVMIIGLSFYFTACCIDLAYQKERVTVRDVLILALVIGVLSPCKMVYAVMMGMCLLIPQKKFGGIKQYLGAAVVVFSAFLIGMLLINSQTVTTYVTETETYVAWAEEAGYSFTYLLHNPGVVLQMFYNTILLQAENYHLNMIGSALGNMDPVLNVPYLVTMAMTVCLLLLSLRKPGDQLHIMGGQKVWIWFLCLAGCGAILFSMLLAWTPVGAQSIQGVQGRYFIPFLLMLLLSLRNDWLVLTKRLDRMIFFSMCCLNGYILLRLFSVVSMRV